MNRFMIILILVILAGFACREEPTKPPTAEFTLTAEDVGVTDVFFRLKATLSHGPFTVLYSATEIRYINPSRHI